MISTLRRRRWSASLWLAVGLALLASPGWSAATGSISGLVFNDVNGNGALDGGETGIVGVTVTLDLGADGTIDASQLTGAGGTYSFIGLLPGTYRVRQVQPAGYLQTSLNPADVVVTSGATSGVDFGDHLVTIIAQVPTLGRVGMGLLATLLALGAFGWLRRTRT